MSEIFNSMSSRNKNIVNLFADRVVVTQCPLVTAMKLAQEHNVTLQFCPKCVHATIGAVSCTVKYSHCDKEQAAILVVQDCIDKFNKLTGKH
jgi:hypothetical protein